jgi:hypothetical protein
MPPILYRKKPTMTKPVFAQGKEFERNLLQPAPAGTKTLYISSPGSFSLGDRIFCADGDGSQTEYLGIVTSVEASAIIVAFSLLTSRDTNATIWRPAEIHSWETVASEPVRRVYREGIAVERALGGALWSVRTADAVQEAKLIFAGITPAHVASFRTWLSTAARSGLDNFTWADERRATATVHLLDYDFKPIETAPESLTLAMHLAIVEEGGYA